MVVRWKNRGAPGNENHANMSTTSTFNEMIVSHVDRVKRSGVLVKEAVVRPLRETLDENYANMSTTCHSHVDVRASPMDGVYSIFPVADPWVLFKRVNPRSRGRSGSVFL